MDLSSRFNGPCQSLIHWIHSEETMVILSTVINSNFQFSRYKCDFFSCSTVGVGTITIIPLHRLTFHVVFHLEARLLCHYSFFHHRCKEILFCCTTIDLNCIGGVFFVSVYELINL